MEYVWALEPRRLGRLRRVLPSSARDMKLDIMGEDTPGPGSYKGGTNDFGRELFQKGPSSSFRSSSAQRAKGKSADTPGAGSYDPRMSAVEPSSSNSGAGMRSKAQRFTTEKQSTDGGVGPGAYDPHFLPGGARSTTAGTVADRVTLGTSAAFRSDTVREMEYS